MNTIGVPQGTFTADFLKPAALRKQVFDQVLKVEAYQSCFRDLLSLERFAKTAVTATEHQLEVLQVQLEPWERLCVAQAQVLAQLGQDQAERDSIQTRLAVLAVAIASLDHAQQAQAAVAQQQQALAQTIALHDQAMQQTAAQLEAATAAAAALARLQPEYDAYRGAEATLATLEQQWQQRQQQLREQQQLQSQAQQLKHDRERLQEKLAQLASLAAQLPTLAAQIVQQRELEGEQAQLVEVAAQLQELHNELAIQQTKLAVQQESAHQTAALVIDARAARQQQQTLAPAHQAYTAATAALGSLRQRLDQRQALVREQQRLQSRLHQQQLQQAQAQQAQRRRQAIEAALQQLTPQIEALQQWEGQWQAAQAAQAHWQQQQRERDSLEQRLRQVQSELSERRQHWQQRHAQQALVEHIPRLEKHLQAAQTQQAQAIAIASLRDELDDLLTTGQQQTARYAEHVQQMGQYCQQHYSQLWPHLHPLFEQGVALPQDLLRHIEALRQRLQPLPSSEIERLQQQLQQAYAIRAQALEPLAQAVQAHEQEVALIELAIANRAQTPAVDLNALEQQRQRLGDPLARQRVLHEEYTGLSAVQLADLSPLQAELAHLETELAESADLPLLIQAQEQQQTTHQAAHEQYLQLSPLAATLADCEAQAQQAQTKAHALASKIQQWQQTIAQLEAEHGSLRAIQSYQHELVQALKTLGNPRQQQQQIEQQLQHKPAWEAEFATLRQHELDRQTQMAALEQPLAATASLDRDRQTQQQQREQYRPAYEAYLRYQAPAAQLHELQAHYQAQQHTRQHHSETQQRLEAEYTASLYDPEQHQALCAEQQDCRDRQTRLEVQISHYATQLDTIQTELDRLKILQHQQEQLEITKKQKEKVEKFIKKMRTIFRDSGPKITALYQQSVNYEADRLFREIMNRTNLSLQWEADYEIVIQEGGQKKRRFSNLSGGEQMVAALAVRLALLRTLASFDVAFFDEPTTNMDAARRQHLAEAISQIRSFAQLFVISHDDTFTHLTEATLRLERL